MPIVVGRNSESTGLVELFCGIFGDLMGGHSPPFSVGSRGRCPPYRGLSRHFESALFINILSVPDFDYRYDEYFILNLIDDSVNTLSYAILFLP